jgi:hypothetical protein
MLDTAVIEQLITQQIKDQVNQQITIALGSDEWLASFEQKILEYVQSRVIAKFSNAEALPEITNTVKASVNELFKHGMIPGIDQYVDSAVVKKSVDIAVEELVDTSITLLGNDPVWLEKIERQINQAVIDRVVRQFGQIDLNPIIKERVDENMDLFRQEILTNFTSTGINDHATSCQLTVMDDTIVVENQLTTRDLTVVNAATINDLAVTGSINIDNRSWDTLANGISEKTLKQLTQEWKETLTTQVTEQIFKNGINFDSVKIGNDALVAGNTLSKTITDTNIQKVGILRTLEVAGETSLNNKTLNVLNKRLGVNTDRPEMALSVWDEEVSIVVGKNKPNEAYVGTNRDQGLVIGVNRTPQIEINTDGLTTVKKLRIGLHCVSHSAQVPGWAATRGDLVFNTNFGDDRVFAWVCLGGHKWQTLKSAE